MKRHCFDKTPAVAICVWMCAILCFFLCHGHPQYSRDSILVPQNFRYHVDYFNTMEPEGVVNYISNDSSWVWMADNIPFFECPDENFERIYYYRWWTLRKHIKATPHGFVFSEFITPVKHAGIYNTISCAFGHHAMESRWLKDRRYLNDCVLFWLRGHDNGPQPHLHKYSSWFADAVYRKYLVDGDKEFLLELLPHLVLDFERWEEERLLKDGLFWQYDERDGMEESISGSRSAKNARPTINSYMYANASAIAEIAAMVDDSDLADRYRAKAHKIKDLIQQKLWDEAAGFFKVRLENGQLSDAREAIGFIPWYFSLPDSLYSRAWRQLKDPEGFDAPCGITTAERCHPAFRSHGVGTCEWDGAVWPFATSQTLVGLANLLNDCDQSYVTKADYFEEMLTYASSHRKDGKPYIGEYLDEQTGEWLKGDSPRSRYYNHSTFCDLVISGLVGLHPRGDDTLEIKPLVPENEWDWFALDFVHYRGRSLTILWDRSGHRYRCGKGLILFVDGKIKARSDDLKTGIEWSGIQTER